jgi:zinc/manganese transport system substrate-binding protein
MSPTPGHLQRLLEGLRASPPAAVVIASYQDPRPGRWLTGQLSSAAAGTRVPLLTLPATVPETAGEKELVLWMEGLVRELLQGLR